MSSSYLEACPRTVQPTDAIPPESGVFFASYTMLSADFGGECPGFKQLTDRLGPDFDGVIAFDEAHLMKNAAGTLPRAPPAAPAPRLRRLKHP
ncbi:MAG: strawberry notch family protein [Planctomycetota bacterium]